MARLGSDVPALDTPYGEVTVLLNAVRRGDVSAQERLWAIIYDELRRIAHAKHRNWFGQPGPETTALVHEAYLRLFGQVRDDQPDTDENGDQLCPRSANWPNRRFFYAAAADAMRNARVDDVRSRYRLKRGGGRNAVQLSDDLEMRAEHDAAELLALDEALPALERALPSAAQVVKLRFFIGLTVDQTAAILDVSPRTAELDWEVARGWLHRAIEGGGTCG